MSFLFRESYRHCACAYQVTCTPYVKFKYIFQFLTPTLPIHYATFIELRWRIRGVLSVTSNVKGKIERKISKSKNLQNFHLLGALEIRGYEKWRFLLQKYHPCVNARRLSHFASKSVGGSDLQRWAGKKTQKVTRGFHRNDVSRSPLTQGLRYRAACDIVLSLGDQRKPHTVTQSIDMSCKAGSLRTHASRYKTHTSSAPT